MGKWEKNLAKLRQNPKHVRFDDLEKILLKIGFVKRQDKTSHAVFMMGKNRMTIPKPHGTPFVKEFYIRKQVIPMLEALGILEESDNE
jgi:predicted RNA binding protein YcfA (HicA-like mRNA interferase family)